MTSTFILDKNATQPTEIYLNKLVWYPSGYKIVASSNETAIDGVSFVGDSNYIQVVFSSDLLAKFHTKEI